MEFDCDPFKADCVSVEFDNAFLEFVGVLLEFAGDSADPRSWEGVMRFPSDFDIFCPCKLTPRPEANLLVD